MIKTLSIMGFRAILSIVILLTLSVYADDDVPQKEKAKNYVSEELGFSMTLLDQMELEDFEKKIWKGKAGILPNARLWAIMAPTRGLKSGDIVDIMSRLTHINGFYWNTVDTGARNGWGSFKIVKGKLDGATMMGIYGEGPRGSYAFAITASEESFDAAESDYRKWIDSIKLLP